MRKPSFSVNLAQIVLVFVAISVGNLIQKTYANNFSENVTLDAQKVPHESPSKQDYEYQRRVITGLAVGFPIVILLLVGFAIFFVSRKIKRLQAEVRELTQEEIDEFLNGGVSENENFPLILGNQDFEISKDRLEIDEDKVLSQGEFSCVYCGLLKDDSETDGSPAEVSKVAIRTLSRDATVTHVKRLLTELKLLSYLGKHENIASLLGAVTVNIRNRELITAMEFCAKGALGNYLKIHRTNFKDLFQTKASFDQKNGTRVSFDPKDGNSSSASETPKEAISPKNSLTDENLTDLLSTLDLVEWARQVSSGMAYISSQHIIHGDVSARNILLTEDKVAKISDFGLAHKLEPNESEYKFTDCIPLPWRWLALESLSDRVFSSKSDVWSFGVLLYEIFSLGKIPYAGQTWDHEFVDELKNGYRLSAPKFSSDEVYSLMMNCMKSEASERVDFPQIERQLESLRVKILPASMRGLLPDCNYIQLDSDNSVVTPE